MSRYNDQTSSVGFFIAIAFWLAIIIGWVINIFKLVGLAQVTDPNLVMAILRAVGIFIPPVGALLGYFV